MTSNLNHNKCYLCKELKEDMFKCEDNHKYCLECAEESFYNCRCGEILKLTKREELPKKCKYKNQGCDLSITEKNLSEHEIECKFRPYNCVGDRMKLWSCSWKGRQHEFENHFRKDHSSIETYEFSGKLKMEFIPQNGLLEMKRINFIDAFNKKFLFYYKSDYEKELLTMIIFLLGRKQNAKKYFYELEISSAIDERIQVKFSLPVYNETENIEQLITDGRCIQLTYNFIKNFVKNNEISLRYRMINKEKHENSMQASCEHLNNLRMKPGRSVSTSRTERNRSTSMSSFNGGYKSRTRI